MHKEKTHDNGNNYKPQRIEITVVIAAFLVDTSTRICYLLKTHFNIN